MEPSVVVATCTAQWSFVGENDVELSYTKGESIRILSMDPQKNWWEGITTDGRRGFFSKNYISNVREVGGPLSSSPTESSNINNNNHHHINHGSGRGMPLHLKEIPPQGSPKLRSPHGDNAAQPPLPAASPRSGPAAAGLRGSGPISVPNPLPHSTPTLPRPPSSIPPAIIGPDPRRMSQMNGAVSSSSPSTLRGSGRGLPNSHSFGGFPTPSPPGSGGIPTRPSTPSTPLSGRSPLAHAGAPPPVGEKPSIPQLPQLTPPPQSQQSATMRSPGSGRSGLMGSGGASQQLSSAGAPPPVGEKPPGSIPVPPRPAGSGRGVPIPTPTPPGSGGRGGGGSGGPTPSPPKSGGRTSVYSMVAPPALSLPPQGPPTGNGSLNPPVSPTPPVSPGGSGRGIPLVGVAAGRGVGAGPRLTDSPAGGARGSVRGAPEGAGGGGPPSTSPRPPATAPPALPSRTSPRAVDTEAPPALPPRSPRGDGGGSDGGYDDVPPPPPARDDEDDDVGMAPSVGRARKFTAPVFSIAPPMREPSFETTAPPAASPPVEHDHHDAKSEGGGGGGGKEVAARAVGGLSVPRSPRKRSATTPEKINPLRSAITHSSEEEDEEPPSPKDDLPSLDDLPPPPPHPPSPRPPDDDTLPPPPVDIPDGEEDAPLPPTRDDVINTDVSIDGGEFDALPPPILDDLPPPLPDEDVPQDLPPPVDDDSSLPPPMVDYHAKPRYIPVQRAKAKPPLMKENSARLSPGTEKKGRIARVMSFRAKGEKRPDFVVKDDAGRKGSK